MFVHGRLTRRIIGAAVRVHRRLGPGLLESAYETCLVHELIKQRLRVEQQVELAIEYDGIRIAPGYRIDALVESTVIVEVKAVTSLSPIHDAQLLTYLRLAGKPVGLLINFNVKKLIDGVRRLALTGP